MPIVSDAKTKSAEQLWLNCYERVRNIIFPAWFYFANPNKFKKYVIFLIVIITIFNMRYHYLIYRSNKIGMITYIKFTPAGSNYTMPNLQICLSHRQQINQLNNTIDKMAYLRSKEGNSLSSFRPKIKDILLHVDWILERSVKVLDLFQQTNTTDDQTCFETRKNVSLHAHYPGGLQGIEMILNIQEYEEIENSLFRHFTSLNIIPFESRDEPLNENKIHISPGTFSSVRLQAIRYDSTVRHADDVPCIKIKPKMTSSVDLCIKQIYIALVTQAKLKYENNLLNLRISTESMDNIKVKLSRAVQLRSKFDPDYRKPAILRVANLIKTTQHMLHFLHINYKSFCSEVRISLVGFNEFYTLPNFRNEYNSVWSIGIRLDRDIKSLFVGSVQNFATHIPYMLSQAKNFMQAIKSSERENNWRITKEFTLNNTSLWKLHKAVLTMAGEMKRLFEKMRSTETSLHKILETLLINKYAKVISDSDINFNDIESQVETLKQAIASIHECLDTGTDVVHIKPFTNRGVPQTFQIINDSHIANITDAQFLPKGAQILHVMHVPGATGIKIPLTAISYCIRSSYGILKWFERFGADRAFDFRNRNSKYTTETEYTLFVLNQLSQDFFSNDGDQFDSFWKNIETDFYTCGIIVGTIKVFTTHHLTFNDVEDYFKSLGFDFITGQYLQSIVRVISAIGNCRSMTYYSDTLGYFLGFYNRYIIRSLEKSVRVVKEFWHSYGYLKRPFIRKKLNLSHHKNSIDSQLSQLLGMLMQLADGGDEEIISQFLSKNGRSVMGALQIQIGEITHRYNNSFKNTQMQMKALVTLEHRIKQRMKPVEHVLLDTVFERMFGASRNITDILTKSKLCLRRLQQENLMLFHHARSAIELWLPSARFFILRAKQYVANQEVSKLFLSKNIAVVHIFLEDFHVQMKNNTRLFTEKQFLSTIGGLLGIYLGKSPLDFVKVVIAILVTCLGWIRFRM